MKRGEAPSGQNERMSRQQRGGGGEVARGAGYSALLGAVLIGIAVVVGIVLLQIGDRNDNGPASAATKKPTTSSTTLPHTGTTVHQGKHTTTTTGTVRPPSSINLIVLNGGAASGKAGAMSKALKLKGYTNQADATDWTGHHQTGNSVYCHAGLAREGTTLATAVGPNAKLHLQFPSPAPEASSGHDCFVVVGAS